MDPYAFEIARQRQDELLRHAERARLAAHARSRRAAEGRTLRGSLGLWLVHVGARVAGRDAVVLAAPVPVRR